jgi:DNA polymerase-3 subunit beta
MQFEVNKSTLTKILSNVQGAVERKNTIPILLNVKIEARAGKLNFTTTDMDIVITSTTSEVTIQDEGITTIPAQLLYDIVRKIPDGTDISITLQEDGNLAIIKYGRSNFSLPCLDPVEFPTLSEGEMTHNFTINGKDLAKIIDNTRFAISNDETRYYLNGLFLHVTKNDEDQFELRGVATDGHRLALSSCTGPNLTEEIPGIIIPKKTVNEIRRVSEGENDMKVSLSKTKIKIESGDSIVISKLIDGQFPQYNQVIPQNNEKVINIDKKTIFDAVDRVATVANDKHRTIKLTLDSGKILLQVSSSDGGFADEEVAVDFEGEKIEAGFNSRYLLEIINQVGCASIDMKFNDNFSPVIVNSAKLNGLYVIMPVRV